MERKAVVREIFTTISLNMSSLVQQKVRENADIPKCTSLTQSSRKLEVIYSTKSCNLIFIQSTNICKHLQEM